MQINSQVYLNKAFLNILNSSQSSFKFEQGEILKVQVEEVNENGLLTIYIKGRLMDVQTTVEVNKGQELSLMVEGIKDGKTILKVLTPEMLREIGDSNLSNTLKEMNVPGNDKNIQLAKKLIQHKLAVTAGNIQILSKGVNLLDGLSSSKSDLVGMAMAKGLPINREALESLLQFVEGESNLASLTGESLDLLSEIEGNNRSMLTKDSFQLLDELMDTIALPLNKSSTLDLSNEISQAIKFNLANESNLLKGLGLVKNILLEKEMPGISKGIINLLIDRVHGLEKELVGQKLANVMSKVSEDTSSNSYYLSFPIIIEDQYRLSQLKIIKDGKGQSLGDMDKIRFQASLDTSRLGLVVFHVEWNKNGSLKIDGIVENEIALKYIEANVSKLIKDLESHNYLVDYQGIKVSENKNEDMRLTIDEKNEVVKAYKVDILI